VAFQSGKYRAKRGAPGVFGREWASYEGARSWGISEKWKSAEGIENKAQSVLAGTEERKIAG
jgi:hypothetical protein